MIQAKISLMSKWQSGEIPSMKYPLDTVSAKGYEQALRELFAESVSGYTMGKTDILDEGMTQFLDFIFLK
jgi:hypothetical protein